LFSADGAGSVNHGGEEVVSIRNQWFVRSHPL
jgi:hypothetical protein